MTKDEFLKKYHNYIEKDGGNAEAEANRFNREEGVDGDKAVAIGFGKSVWGIMLKSAAIFMGLYANE